MKEQFKIDRTKIKYLALRDLRSGSILILVGLTFVFAYEFVVKNNADTPLKLVVIPTILILLSSFFILLYAYKFKLIYFSNYLIIVDEEGITQKVIINKKTIQKNLRKWLWTKNIVPYQKDTKIEWKNAKDSHQTHHGLIINSLLERKNIFVPHQLENFQILANYIKERIPASR